MEFFRPGGRIHIEKHAPSVASDLTLIFYHGSMASVEQWHDLLPILKALDKFNIICYDSLGCGKSDKPFIRDTYSPESLLNDGLEILKTYGTTRNILIGHSFGSAQVVRICNTLKKKKININIEASILIGTAHSLPSGGHPVFLLPVFILNWMQSYLSDQFISTAFSPHTKSDIKDKARSLSSKNNMEICKYFYQQFQWLSGIGDEIGETTKSSSLSPTLSPSYSSSNSSSFSSRSDKIKEKEEPSLDPGSSVHDWGHFRLLSVPTLIIQGEDDRITPLESAQRVHNFLLSSSPPTSDSSPSSTSIASSLSSSPIYCIQAIPRAGHQVMQERPEEVAQAILSFLQSLRILN